MQIYRASKQHLKTIQNIGTLTYRQHFNHLWTEQGIMHFLAQDFSHESLEKSLSDATQIWLLIENEDQICCGYAKLNLDKTQPDLNIQGSELQKIYLLDDAIGKNNAAQLMQFILEIARKNKQQFIYLEVLKNNLRAQHFYQKFGFKNAIDIPFATDLDEIGMQVMLLKL